LILWDFGGFRVVDVMRWWGRFLFGGDRLPLLFFDKPARTALGLMGFY
jgi:hypothetical protein